MSPGRIKRRIQAAAAGEALINIRSGRKRGRDVGAARIATNSRRLRAVLRDVVALVNVSSASSCADHIHAIGHHGVRRVNDVNAGSTVQHTSSYGYGSGVGLRNSRISCRCRGVLFTGRSNAVHLCVWESLRFALLLHRCRACFALTVRSARDD